MCSNCPYRRAPLDGAAIVLAIAADIGPVTFTVAQLTRWAKVEDNTRLRTALTGYSNKTIGKALKRVAGQSIDGLRLDRCRTVTVRH